MAIISKKWLWRAILVTAAWTAMALTWAFQTKFQAHLAGQPKSFLLTYGIPAIEYSFFLLATGPIAWYVTFLQRSTMRLIAKIAAHIAGVFAFYVLITLWWVPFQPLFHTPINRKALLDIASTQICESIWVYVLVGGIALGLQYYRNLMRARLRESEYRAGLVEARLRTLKLQLQPHFLFNTLHSVSALLRHNPDAADSVIADLGALLRLSLDTADTQEVPVEEELKALGLYLNIQRVRFQEWLTLRLTVSEAMRTALMPHLLLQPLVENAIRHGIARRASPGTLTVEIDQDGPSLRLCVRDDGPGLENSLDARAGVGLSNTKARLQMLYGSAYSLQTQNSPDGFAITILIPYRATEAACSAQS